MAEGSVYLLPHTHTHTYSLKLYVDASLFSDLKSIDMSRPGPEILVVESVWMAVQLCFSLKWFVLNVKQPPSISPLNKKSYGIFTRPLGVHDLLNNPQIRSSTKTTLSSSILQSLLLGLQFLYKTPTGTLSCFHLMTHYTSPVQQTLFTAQ